VKGGDIMLVVGLFVATVGAVMLAYDPVFGSGARFRLRIVRRQLAISIKELETLKQDYKSNPNMANDEYWQQDLAKQETKYLGQQDQLRMKIELLDKHEDRTVTLAANGVILLIVGFLLQLGGTLWTSLISRS
jgi:hypothetical protein